MTSSKQNFFRRRRVELGLTQREVAQRLDITIQAVSNWELGNNVPRLGMLHKLAAVYQVEPQQIAQEVGALAAPAA